MVKRVGIVDAVSIVYASCCVSSLEDPVNFTLHIIKKQLQRIKDDLKLDEMIVVIGGKGNYRYDIEPEYKANRKYMDLPPYLEEAKEYIQERWGAIAVEGMEADDYVGIYNYANKDTQDVIMVHIDKDLNMLEGKHYNYKKELLYEVTAVEAWRQYHIQMLVGDATDNIKGLFKLRGRKAMPKVKAPILEMTNPKDMMAYVKSVYLDELPEEEHEAMLNELRKTSSLLWIKRK